MSNTFFDVNDPVIIFDESCVVKTGSTGSEVYNAYVIFDSIIPLNMVNSFFDQSEVLPVSMFSGAPIDLQITFSKVSICKLFGIEKGA